MGSRLTQRSHKCSHRTSSAASRLTRKRGVYYYRRRLPDRLGTDLALSFRTRNYREAEHLAEVLDAEFSRVVSTVSTSENLRSILRKYLDDVLAEDAEMRLTAPAHRSVYTNGFRIDADRSAVDVDEELVSLLLSEARERLALRDFKSVTVNVDHVMREYGLPQEQRNAVAYGVLEANVKMLEELRRRVLGEVPLIFTAEAPEPTAPPVATIPAGPLFSEVLPRYVDHAVKNKGWRGQSKAQNEATFGMFVEVCGDLPVETYTRRHLGEFYDTLLALPTLYSKDKRWRGLSLREVVDEARADGTIKRLTVKTAARHFSALGGFFTYAKRHGVIDGENPAHGFEFPRQGRANSKRQMWEGTPLRKLFQSPVWTGCHPVMRSQPGPQIIRDDKFWLPLLGLYHGNRLEEFAQLRREDVKRDGSIWYLDIHGDDGRQIKNDQSARRVPIHPAIEGMGFLDYVTDTAPRPADMVFPLLRPGGPDRKVGYYFTKWWTNYRRAVGVYEPGLDYHSFRHGVTTKLFAARTPRDIIDELTGHEGEGTSQRVYKHDTPLPLLLAEISKVEWPELTGGALHNTAA